MQITFIKFHHESRTRKTPSHTSGSAPTPAGCSRILLWIHRKLIGRSETIRLCALQRPALCTKRQDMLSRVGRWLQTPQAEEWEYLSRPSTEYKLVLRHMLVLRGLNELADHY